LLYTASMVVTVRGTDYPNPILNATVSGDSPTSPTQYIYNPVDVEVLLENVDFQITLVPFNFGGFLTGYPAFDTSLFYHPYSCPSSNNAGSITAANATQYIAPDAVTSFLLNPNTGPHLCQGYLSLAACCGLIFGNFSGSPPPEVAPPMYVNVEGTTDVTIGEFSFSQYFSQKNIPIYCIGNTTLWAFSCEYLINDYCIKNVQGEFCNQPYFP